MNRSIGRNESLVGPLLCVVCLIKLLAIQQPASPHMHAYLSSIPPPPVPPAAILGMLLLLIMLLTTTRVKSPCDGTTALAAAPTE